MKNENLEIKKKRKKAADFLQKLLDFVEEKDKQKGFKFSKYVSEYNEELNCGTVCCMEGWLPALYPKKLTWGKMWGTYQVVNINDDELGFYPKRMNIPISNDLWDTLTLPSYKGDPFFNVIHLSLHSKFSKVKEGWDKVIEKIRNGELDNGLI